VAQILCEYTKTSPFVLISVLKSHVQTLGQLIKSRYSYPAELPPQFPKQDGIA